MSNNDMKKYKDLIQESELSHMSEEEAIKEIAKRELFVNNLEMNNRDRDDFVDVSKAGIENALRRAINYGRSQRE